MPRIPPLPEGDWDDDLRPILEAAPRRLEGGRLGDNNIFSSLARHKDLFRAWLPFDGKLIQARWSGEAAWIPLGERRLEVSFENATSHPAPGEILFYHGPDADGWSAADATLLRAADELHERSKISDQTWAALAETYDERGLIEIPMLVGHYHLVAYALNSLEVELDEGLEPLP